MVTPSYSITCLRKTLLAPNVYELVFERPKGFTFKAGQFVLFDVPVLSNPTDLQPRAYSLASTPDEPDLLFIVKLKEGGRFSVWLEQQIEVGSSLTIKGPFGFFTLRQNTNDCLFVATGAGIAPFRGHILDALKYGNTRTMHLFFGVRNEDDLFWTKTFKELKASHSNLHLHLCLSRASPDWKGKRGRVQDFIPEVIKDPHATDLYVCGAPEMVNDIKKTALEIWSIPKGNVHGEGYV